MGEGSREKDRDELPTVESLLFAGLLRVRKADQDPGIVLEEADAAAGALRARAVDVGAKSGVGATSGHPRYVYQGEIGRGGMGAVHKVLDTDLQRTIAMKVAHGSEGEPEADPPRGEPSLLERFLEEAQVTGQLDHPGVVPLHEVGIDSAGRVYFTMRFVRGRHLGEVFELAGRGEEGWNEERVLIALVRVCEAMAYAHAKGVVHRDLKPANVMAGRFGEVYVMDWGLAKVRGRERDPARRPADPVASSIRTSRTKEKPDDARRTTHGTVFGTPAYMSPEQARGEVDRIDPRSDIYSLGAILYQFLTGSAPYSLRTGESTASSVIERLLAGPPDPVGKLAPRSPPELAAICAKTMARRPEDRYADMAAVAEDLRSYLAGRPVSALPLGTLGRVLRWCRRNRLAAGLLVAVTAGSVYGISCLASLGSDLVRETALDSVAMKSQILQDVNSFYSSQVAGRVDREHVEVTHDYAAKAGAIPIPATFLTELGERISGHTGGVKVRQYSDAPFRFRQPWALDDFETSALAKLRAEPEKPVFSFESVDGKPVLRYAIGRRMEASCVACHNTHEASPKTDWKIGDVRGVLEIIRPLDQDFERMKSGLRGTLLVVAAIVGGLLLLSVVGIVRSAAAKGRA